MSDDATRLNICGCCEPEPETPPTNPPGQPALAYRIGTHAAFLRRMLARLPRQRLPDGDHVDTRPLAELTTRDRDDPAIALLDAWATVGHVLAFYQERIANEAYLRTATERRSVLELARAIGYELGPGVAAEAHLAFTVDDSDSTPNTATVKAGTRVQSIPAKEGELPQTFETAEDFTAHTSWNTLQPQLTEPQTLARETTAVFFAGTGTNLRAGDRLLLIGEAKEKDWTSNEWDLRRVLKVENQPEKQRTRVKVTTGIRQPPDDVALYVLRQRAAIFGHTAPDWNGLSKQVRSDYLGLDSVDDLDAADRGEWPDFTICAPGSTPGPKASFPREVEVTARGVADAAIGAADAQAATLGRTAAAAVPATVVAVGQGIATVVRKMADAGVTELDTLRNAFPTGTHDDLTGTPLYRIANAVIAIAEELITSIGLQPPDLSWDDLSESDDFFAKIAELVSSLNTQLNQLVVDLSSGTTKLTVDLPELNTHLNDISQALNALRLAHPLLLPFSILESAQTELADSFGQASAAAEAVAAAGTAGAVAQVLDGVLETVMALDPTPQEVARIARFTVKTARYGGMLVAPQTLFPQEVDLPAPDSDLSYWQLEELINQPGIQLPEELQHLDDPEDQLALMTAIGVAAVGPTGAAVAASSGGVPAVAVAALGTALLPLVLAGPSVKHGAAQIADAVVVAVDKALDPADETVVSKRPVFTSDICRIDLDNRYDAIGPESWVYLESDTGGELYRVTGTDNRSRAEFLISAEVTRLTLGGPPLDPFKPKVRQTKLYGAPEKLELAPREIEPPVQGLQIDLETRLEPTPPAGTALIVKGTTVDGLMDAEQVTIESAILHAGRTRLRLASSLDASYRRDTVEIFANVVPATHGETVDGEVLGSGDGARSNQRFTLKHSPLTFVSAATASGAQSTLALRVNNLLWRHVPSLHGRRPTDQVYTLRIDDAARATVVFGDGKQGARLPSGEENVRAVYRFGIGSAGEVGADTLTLLKKRPFGVKSVTNPLAATGAEDPETLDEARGNAPFTVLTLERIVALRDYQDFARAFAGIGKALAVALWDGETERVHLTVAAANGDTVDRNSALYANLRAAIENVRDPRRLVEIGSYRLRYFELAARLLIDPAHDRAAVKSAVEAALAEGFSFAARDFGQPVSAAEVVGLIHGVAGVTAVDLEKLYRLDETGQPLNGPPLAAVLPAHAARPNPTAADPQRFLPAELLLIHAPGIALTEWQS